ncbi:MAG TPA: hypothetical protein VNO31_09190 [Umezawaea sp.]|nr:hypothetical protein [Umezawaea sp.]
MVLGIVVAAATITLGAAGTASAAPMNSWSTSTDCASTEDATTLRPPLPWRVDAPHTAGSTPNGVEPAVWPWSVIED